MPPGQPSVRTSSTFRARLVLTHRFGSCLVMCAAAVRVSASSSPPGSSVGCLVLGLAGGWSKGGCVCSAGALCMACGSAGRSSAQAEGSLVRRGQPAAVCHRCWWCDHGQRFGQSFWEQQRPAVQSPLPARWSHTRASYSAVAPGLQGL